MKLFVLIMALSWSVVSCTSTRPPAGIFVRPLWETRSPDVFVVSGLLLTNWTEQQMGVARYRLTNLDYQLRCVEIDVTFYHSTRPPELPNSALLLLKRDGRYKFRVFGEDGSKGIFPDSSQNRQMLQHKVDERLIFPPKHAWLEKRVAKLACQKALLLRDSEIDTATFRFRRYELGWEVHVVPAATKCMIGGDCTVVVGDDGVIKAVYKGF